MKRLKNALNKIKSKGGFTLVECVYALAVFAIVISFITPMFMRADKEVQDAKNYDRERNLVLEQLENFKSDYISTYIAQNGIDYPTSGIQTVTFPQTGDANKKVVLYDLKTFKKQIENPSISTAPGAMEQFDGWLLYLKCRNGKNKFEIFVPCTDVGFGWDNTPLDGD